MKHLYVFVFWAKNLLNANFSFLFCLMVYLCMLSYLRSANPQLKDSTRKSKNIKCYQFSREQQRIIGESGIKGWVGEIIWISIQHRMKYKNKQTNIQTNPPTSLGNVTYNTVAASQFFSSLSISVSLDYLLFSFYLFFWTYYFRLFYWA